MKYRAWLVAIVVGSAGWTLACSGLLAGPAPDGPLVLDQAAPNPCGQWTAVAKVPEHPIDWKLQVWSGDVQLQELIVPAGATEVSITQSSGQPGPQTVYLKSARGPGEPVTLQIPTTTAGISVPSDPWGPHPEGEIPKLPVTVLAACDDKSHLRVSATASPGGLQLASRVPVSADGRVDVPLDPVVQGIYAIDLSVWSGESRAAQRTTRLLVGPPCVDLDGDGVLACKGDCNDQDPNVKPGVVDVVGDGIDNDCDGVNGQDVDRDGSEAQTAGGPDCNDNDPTVLGTGLPPDLDGDGHYAFHAVDWDCDGEVEQNPGLFDCDDQNPGVPQPHELPDPNGVDDNCNGIIDEGTVAYDDDGDGQAELEGDCNDADKTVYKGAREAPDCKDNNCDGEIDEGLARPTAEDRYEPNDGKPFELQGAQKKKQFLGIDTGYRPTAATLDLVTRDREDIERFSVWTHDGNIDTWNVTARVVSKGDATSYDVEIVGNGRRSSLRLREQGDQVQILGSPRRDNSGTYEIIVTPVEAALTHCPLVLRVSSG